MAYLDDAVIYTKNEDHLQHLEEPLHLIEQAGYKHNLNKYQFGAPELT